MKQFITSLNEKGYINEKLEELSQVSHRNMKNFRFTSFKPTLSELLKIDVDIYFMNARNTVTL